MKRTALLLLLTACAGGGGGGGISPVPAPRPSPSQQPHGVIKHIVIVVQENRTPDNLFHGFPGADTTPSAPMVPVSLKAAWDIRHHHSDWEAAYDGGKMDGWNGEACSGRCPQNAPYAYVPRAEVQPYWDLAREYGFANRMFQTQQGPSFPAHQYLISGTSSIDDTSPRLASENAGNLSTHQGGCDSPANSRVETIGPDGIEGDPVFPCFNRRSIFTLLDGAGLTWRYYQANAGSATWNAVDALKPLCPSTPCAGNAEYAANVRYPSARVLTDVAKGDLADVTFVTPTFLDSDHAGVTDGSGPDWVASVVNAIGRSPDWNTTAILITWDDWGGWYDHVAPHVYDAYSNGFRVPLLVISPYTKRGYVSQNEHTFGSLLRFTEETLGLGSLGTTDARSDDLADFFDFNRAPRAFHAIRTERGDNYFLAHALTEGPPDND